MFWRCEKGHSGARIYAKLGGWDSLEQLMSEFDLADEDVAEGYWLVDEEVEFADYPIDSQVLVISICGRRFWSLGVEAPRFQNSIFIAEERFDEVFN
ncbi:MAG: hypothetical protein ACE5M4_14915 [Anaerolineales bacterium]